MTPGRALPPVSAAFFGPTTVAAPGRNTDWITSLESVDPGKGMDTKGTWWNDEEEPDYGLGDYYEDRQKREIRDLSTRVADWERETNASDWP